MQTARAPQWAFPEPEVMEISGYLDSVTGEDAEQDVAACIQSGSREMILDCSHLNYITGAGMRAILAMARNMESVGGRFAVCGLNAQVRSMFEACGFNTILTIYGDRDEAVTRVAA